jgi:hypothetical protein
MCSAALTYSPQKHHVLSLPLALVQQEHQQLERAVAAAMGPVHISCEVAAFAASVEAAVQAGRAAALLDRQQLWLRLASLLCSCVKVLARDWQHMS